MRERLLLVSVLAAGLGMTQAAHAQVFAAVAADSRVPTSAPDPIAAWGGTVWWQALSACGFMFTQEGTNHYNLGLLDESQQFWTEADSLLQKDRNIDGESSSVIIEEYDGELYNGEYDISWSEDGARRCRAALAFVRSQANQRGTPVK
ncbi:MAG: hypothetical protein EON59_12715 [Alphaproteobacteria bacterium]|nr:MAG: hypothetical protein EON59_12715 [Alphaproteobacteria bacterium]